MSPEDKSLTKQSRHGEIDAFLKDVKAVTSAKRGATGCLIFAMDATYSRKPAWDMACHIQGEMFLATDQIGGLQIKLAYYGGFNTFKVSRWLHNSHQLLKLMSSVACEGGKTQISRLLGYVVEENKRQSIDALVFIGDCMEEDADHLSELAAQLGLAGVPIFIFQEGINSVARQTFRHLCRLSKGFYCAFDAGSAEQLKALLGAVAIYATSGQKAFLEYAKENKITGLLSYQLK